MAVKQANLLINTHRALLRRKVDELVHRQEAKAAGVPVIRRFSGGGTVAVDCDTVFSTLVSDETTLPEVPQEDSAVCLIVCNILGFLRPRLVGHACLERAWCSNAGTSV